MNPIQKLWLWKNFVGGRPEYWAFDNAFPINLENGDPQTLGEPCGYAILKPSRQGRTDVSDEQVLRRIAGASPPQAPSDEQLMELARDECENFRWPSTALSIMRKAIAAADVRGRIEPAAWKLVAEALAPLTIPTSTPFDEARAAILALPADDLRALATSQFILLQLRDKYATGEAPARGLQCHFCTRTNDTAPICVTEEAAKSCPNGAAGTLKENDRG